MKLRRTGSSSLYTPFPPPGAEAPFVCLSLFALPTLAPLPSSFRSLPHTETLLPTSFSLSCRHSFPSLCTIFCRFFCCIECSPSLVTFSSCLSEFTPRYPIAGFSPAPHSLVPILSHSQISTFQSPRHLVDPTASSDSLDTPYTVDSSLLPSRL